MKTHKPGYIISAMVALVVYIFLSAAVVEALEIKLVPPQAQRNIDQKVRVQIWATGARCPDQHGG